MRKCVSVSVWGRKRGRESGGEGEKCECVWCLFCVFMCVCFCVCVCRDLVSISSTLDVRIFCTNFVFSSYVLALSKKFVRKIRVFNVGEIDGRRKRKVS